VIETGDPYVYPGTTILRNRLGITESRALDRVERRPVVQRTREGVPVGSFDLIHLRAIHHHLFQDIYDWAGELRTVEIRQAAVIIGDVNYVHPFREGNGRTQLQYLKQLAIQAGHSFDLARIDAAGWIEASKASHAADYSSMADAIRRVIEKS
jgi:cell filamentation protein